MRGFGVGFDLAWGERGFASCRDRGDHLVDRVADHLARGRDSGYDAVFGSLQPKGRAWLDIRDYQQAWDDFAARTEGFAIRTLHHTLLDLGAIEPYDRSRILALTNALIDRCGFAWVNEDLGLWSLRGHPLAYPLPPLLDEPGLAAAIRNVDEVAAGLRAPLLVEFPGFSQGASLRIGELDAYDFLRRLAEATGVGVTLDVGHLLSWRWLIGERGESLFAELDRLPLAHCVEIHLSGCTIVGERFFDDHRGVLLDEQFELLERLLPRCPGLRVVTYEDPALAEDGSLAPECRASQARLRAIVEAWQAGEAAIEPAPAPVDLDRPAFAFDEAGERAERLERVLFAGELDPTIDPESAAAIRELLITELLQRSHRGSGTLADRFPRTLAAWRARRPDDPELRELGSAFLASPQHAEHRELPFTGLGTCLEDAFARFAAAIDLGDPDEREVEWLAAVILALVVDRDPAFELPSFVRRAPQGWYAITRSQPPVLHAALAGRYVSGPLTELLAAVLRRPDEPERVAAELAVGPTTLASVCERLAAMGLRERGVALDA
ncbi:DUF692 family multinuclear iron-containing protein [Nannocystaceae bacterium ST9]